MTMHNSKLKQTEYTVAPRGFIRNESFRSLKTIREGYVIFDAENFIQDSLYPSSSNSLSGTDQYGTLYFDTEYIGGSVQRRGILRRIDS